MNFQLHPLGGGCPFWRVRPGRIDARRGDRHARPDDRLPAVRERFLLLSIDMQEPVAPTERIVGDLKAAGTGSTCFRTSREFIAFLRRFPVYRLFDGEVVSARGR